MGAGQVGGMATLLDIDFNNAAGFLGVKSDLSEAQYVVYYMSQAMLFCVGALIEAHVVLTPASCIHGERYKFDVFGGTHHFVEHAGISREVEHIAIHRRYNDSMRWDACSYNNLALLMLGEQFMLHSRQQHTEYIMNRLRYGIADKPTAASYSHGCRFYGWGSRRNGYLIPLLIQLRRVDVTILDSEDCLKMWNHGDKYLCIQDFTCKTERHGALCPDDLGSVIECSGFLRGMMTSRLIDRPCGVGFLDMSKFTKFLTCGVDDSRDILGHDDFMEFEFGHTTVKTPSYKLKMVAMPNETIVEETDADPGPPTTHSTVSGEEEETTQNFEMPIEMKAPLEAAAPQVEAAHPEQEAQHEAPPAQRSPGKSRHKKGKKAARDGKSSSSEEK